MARSRRLAAVLSLALFALGCGGATVRAPEGPPPPFLAHFTTAHEQLLALNDPLPAVRRVLESPGLRRALAAMRAAGPARDDATPEEPDRLLAAVAANERWVPAEVALGSDAAGLALLGAMARVGVLTPVGGAARTLEDAGAARVLGEVEAETVALVEGLRVPSLRVYARMRAPAEAAAVVEEARALLERRGAPAGVEAALEPGRVRLSVRVGDLAPEPILRAALANIGLVTAFDAPAATRAAATIAAWRVDATLEAAGADGVLLTLGPAPGGEPLKMADVGPLLRWEAADLAWGRWTARPFRESLAGAEALWARWRDTPAGKIAAEADEGYLDALPAMVRDAARHGATGTARAWREADGTLRAEVRSWGAPPAPALSDMRVASLVPASAEGFEVRSNANAGEVLASSLLAAEDRLGVAEVRALLGDDDGGAAVEAMAGRYYAAFEAFRAQVLDAGPARFEPGAAWLVGTRGVVKRVGVALGEGPGGLDFDGADLPILEFALVGRPKDAARGEAFVRDVYGAWVAGIRRVTGAGDDAPGAAALEPADLGLGRLTWVFGGGWVESLAAAHGLKLALTAEGDLQAHCFFVDDHLVVSTSPRLSREIVASAEGRQPSLALPGVEGRLVQAGRFPGSVVSAYARHLAAWLEALHAPDGASAVEGFRASGELFDLFGAATWQVVQDDEEQTTHVTATFR